jgi:hypothetical protein
MSLVAKRKVSESWREAVLRRDPSGRSATDFDRRRRAGASEAEAAFRALAAAGLLWSLETDAAAARPAPGPAGKGALASSGLGPDA